MPPCMPHAPYIRHPGPGHIRYQASTPRTRDGRPNSKQKPRLAYPVESHLIPSDPTPPYSGCGMNECQFFPSHWPTSTGVWGLGLQSVGSQACQIKQLGTLGHAGVTASGRHTPPKEPQDKGQKPIRHTLSETVLDIP